MAAGVMEIYVDVIGTDDRYRASKPSFIAPSLPVAVLGSPAFFAASCRDAAGPHRVFHVEGERYLDGDTVAGAGIRDRDSVVLVAPVDGSFPAPSELRLRWSAAGGVARRLVLLGFFECDARQRQRRDAVPD